MHNCSQSRARLKHGARFFHVRKMPVYHPDDTAQKISASLAVILLFAKLTDSLQEQKSFLKSLLAKYYQRQFNNARQILESEGFNSNLIDQLLTNQEQVELLKTTLLDGVCNPVRDVFFCPVRFET